MPEHRKLEVGQLRLHVRFGTEAVYRVRDWDEATVSVEVVHAPGLERGQVFRFDRETVVRMSLAVPDQLRKASAG
jgi:hypothetical protein